MIPFPRAERLYEAAPEPKSLLVFDRYFHNDLPWAESKRLLEAFRKFIASSVR
jgi:fermentation-respiration switch protein FrsA (DUF1100 family)